MNGNSGRPKRREVCPLGRVVAAPVIMLSTARMFWERWLEEMESEHTAGTREP